MKELERIDGWLDGELSPDDAIAFRGWLKADAANVQTFVRRSRLHWQLREALGGEAQDTGRVASSSEDPRARRTGRVGKASSVWRRPRVLALAASLGLLLLTSAYVFLARKTDTSIPDRGPNAWVPVEDTPLAILASSDHAVWHDSIQRRPGSTLATRNLELTSGRATIRFGSGAVVVLDGKTSFEIISANSSKLNHGRLWALVPAAAHGFRVDTPQAQVIDLGTRFGLIVEPSGRSDIHVLEGSVEVLRGQGERRRVGAGQAVRADAPPSTALTPIALEAGAFVPAAGPASRPAAEYQERFLSLWQELHEPKNGYFSASGLPYHSVETFIVEAPDHGHQTTSEALSYWLWLQAKYGHLTGDWSKFTSAWESIEKFAIPAAPDQPTNRFYNAGRPATYVPEQDKPSQYPASLRQDVPVGLDPISEDLKRTYGTPDVYGMHWLLDLDNWYGFGRRGDGTTAPAFMNTFQRGPLESVWATVPHPSWETFRFGGKQGYLDLFVAGASPATQWRYTNAPDADARAVQATYWALQWARQRNQQDQVTPALAKATKMGDYLRYALFDKYFKKIGSRSERDGGGSGYDSAHYLLSWYYAWGGPTDPSGGWAYRTGCSHVHSGYQNPLAAWVLAEQSDLRPRSPRAPVDWAKSLQRQLELYQWLQSAEGGIAGGATNSWNGRYQAPPAGASTFYGMAYDWQPVYHDPPSNNWFGMQTWTMGRVAELYYVTGDKAAAALLDRWVPWAMSSVVLADDGSYLVPQNLRWSGQPDSWNPASPRTNANLHVEVVSRSTDIGVAASLARTLLYYSAAKKKWDKPAPQAAAMARQVLDRMWSQFRDELGLSAPEERPDYRRLFDETVHVPQGFNGRMPNGDPIKPGLKFIDLRSKYRSDPSFPDVERAYRAGKAPVFRYHRFWAQVEAALANAAAAELDTGN